MTTTIARRGDALVRTISRAGGIGVRVVVGTALVAEAVRRHQTSPTASVALGRALMGAVLVGASAKQGATVQLQFRGDGPLGSVVAIADDEGRARGYVTHPRADLPPVGGALDVAGAVGCGVLAVVRQRSAGGAPYNGIVPLATGTIAQDLALYLTESEQSHSAVGLGVYLDPDGAIEAAGGYTVHALPDATADEIDLAEANVRGFPGPGELVREGYDADAIADRLLAGLGSRERHTKIPAFHCGCGRERVLRAVSLLEVDELATAARGDEPLEVHCHFCAEHYRVTPAEIETLLAQRAT